MGAARLLQGYQELGKKTSEKSGCKIWVRTSCWRNEVCSWHSCLQSEVVGWVSQEKQASNAGIYKAGVGMAVREPGRDQFRYNTAPDAKIMPSNTACGRQRCAVEQ